MADYFMSGSGSKPGSRRTSYNELDSSNDIFGETPEASPQIRPGFRQPLLSSNKHRQQIMNQHKDLNRSNEVIVGETPESSPVVESNQAPSRRIPSDPADSGISDSGTKSKSVTPESRFMTPRSPESRLMTPRSPASRLMTPRTQPSAHRSPKVVYASDSEGSDVSAQILTDDESEDEQEQEHVKKGSVEQRRKVESDSDEESIMLVRKKMTNAAIISSDESGDESINLKAKSAKPKNLISDDESDDDEPLVKSKKDKLQRNKIVSEESSDEDSSFSQEITKKKIASEMGARSKTYKQNTSTSFSQDQDDDVSRLITRKPVFSRKLSSSEDESPTKNNSSTSSEEIVLTPPPFDVKKNTSTSSEEIMVTPPPDFPKSSRGGGLEAFKNKSISRTRQENSLETVSEDRISKNQEVVVVSSDDDEVQVVEETRKSKYNEGDITELEDQIKKLKNCILMNNHMANTSGRRLPDGGASLRRTVQQDSIQLQKLRETLAKARSELYQSSGGVFQPQKPSMLKSISGSSLSSMGGAAGSGGMTKSISSSSLGGRSMSGSSLGGRSVSGSNLPLMNESPRAQLERCRKKKQDLENALKFSSRLSDGGDILREKIKKTNEEIEALEKQVSSDEYNFTESQDEQDPSPTHSNQAYQNLKASFMTGMQMGAETLGQMFGVGPQQQLYGGRMTTSRQREVKNVTHEAMEKLHKSLESMPAEGDMEDQPKLLKSSITLFPHQKQALAWLLWREHQTVAPGGILADDMGLGKTLTMISLILKQNEIEDLKGEDEDKNNTWNVKGVGSLIKTRTTLIICPASLLGQWDNEIKNKVKSGVLKSLVYHGPKARNASAREMSRYDVIITTYGVILSEVKAALGDSFKEAKKLEAMGAAEEISNSGSGKLLSLAFQRIILDEAHQVRNPRSLQSQAVCKLRARRRWCVTGTPVQNKELDLYSLIRFLRCAPFDEYQVWKRWVENKSAQSIDRMNALVKSLVLRRTKDQKSVLTGKVLVELPDKNITTHEIKLSEEEKEVYLEVEKFARGAMARFMDQGEEDGERKEMGLGSGISISGGNNLNSDFAFNPYKDEDEKVKAHHLLTLLLRMRQICCHPGLIKGMLDQETKEAEGIQEEGEELDLISKLEDMTINKENKEPSPVKILQLDNPVFKESSVSSKIDKVVTELRRLKEKGEDEGVVEKAVVVSQWTSMLNIVKHHVREEGLKFAEINGQVSISSRSEIVESFNQNKRGPQIMLLSLAAGGVGLNLVGANHLFLLDVHWNPQLESQACDRIYRVGQTRDVKIHKFMVKETVEERIFKLQEKKLKLADDVLSGAKKRGANSLSLDDLKSLFGLK